MKKKLTAGERALADVDRLEELLADLGVPARRDTDGTLRLESGREVFVAVRETPANAARRIRSEQHTADIADLARLLALEVPNVTVQRAGSEMLFRIDGDVVAGLSTTHARLKNGGTVECTVANINVAREFLREGLRTAAFARPTRHVRASRAAQHTEHVYLKLPNGMPQSAKDAAMESSTRLRTSRSIDPALAVEIETEIGTFRFDPIQLRNPLEAHFRLERGPDYFVGGLRLKTPRDPLALRVHDYGSGRLFADAWAGALVIYAHLTCVEGGAASETEAPRIRERHRAAASGTSLAGTSTCRGSGRRQSQADETTTYTTIADAHRALEAVSGHVRRLPRGQEPGGDALHAAEVLGIRLPEGCTWVRAHSRGAGLIRLARSVVPDLW